MSALTSEALRQLDQLNTQGGLPPPSPAQDKWETDSDCSYYSLSDLTLDKWYRQIPASQVRKQAKQIPARPVSSQSIYPRRFHNKEELALQSSGPWQEYPFCLNKGYVSGSPGPVRIITNSAGSGEFDVVYHLEGQKGRLVWLITGQRGIKRVLVGGSSLQHNPYIAAHLAGYQQGLSAAYYAQSSPPAYVVPVPLVTYGYLPVYGQYLY
uniref:Uncharacterized protein n=1 Tax=Fusarium oxysporum (strain Fo5176) TaxID=660025 RepID=A0A0D2Y6W5_FUSOF